MNLDHVKHVVDLESLSDAGFFKNAPDYKKNHTSVRNPNKEEEIYSREVLTPENMTSSSLF